MKKDIIAREIQDELLVYDPRSDTVHILNPTARVIFIRHREGASPEEIAATLRQCYDVADNVDILADIQSCLENFRQKELI